MLWYRARLMTDMVGKALSGSGWAVRLADLQRDRAGIVELLGEFLPESERSIRAGLHTRAEWIERRYDWLYRRCPHGPAVTWLATREGSRRPVGVTSIFPRDMVIGGAPARGAIGGEAWVRHEMRRRGIASEMHRQCREAMKERGLQVMLGTPRRLNFTPLASADAFDLDRTHLYKRPLDARPFGIRSRAVNAAARALLSPRWPGLSLDGMARDDARVDAVWHRTAREIQVGTVRDARFYTWRFLDMPSRTQVPHLVLQRGEPIAVCALEEREDALVVVDLVAPRARWWQALSAIAAHGREQHRALAIRLLRRDPRAGSLWRYGFLPVKERLVWMVNLLLPDTPGHAALRDPEAWFYTYADFNQSAGD
jgi:GNAT superfamily N-acetyltransferase